MNESHRLLVFGLNASPSSEYAFDYFLRCELKLSDRLILFHVQDSNSPWESSPQASLEDTNLPRFHFEHISPASKQLLNRFVNQAKSMGVQQVDTFVSVGILNRIDAFNKFIHDLRQQGESRILVVLGDRSKHSLAQSVFGSFAARVFFCLVVALWVSLVEFQMGPCLERIQGPR